MNYNGACIRICEALLHAECGTRLAWSMSASQLGSDVELTAVNQSLSCHESNILRLRNHLRALGASPMCDIEPDEQLLRALAEADACEHSGPVLDYLQRIETSLMEAYESALASPDTMPGIRDSIRLVLLPSVEAVLIRLKELPLPKAR